MPDIRIVPGNAVMSFTSSLNYIEKLTQDPSGSLTLYGSGSTGRTELFSIDGNNGRLFSVSDDLSDSLFSVNTIAGLPVIEAFADNTVKIGKYGAEAIVISGSNNTLQLSGSIKAVSLGTSADTNVVVFNTSTKALAYNTALSLQGTAGSQGQIGTSVQGTAGSQGQIGSSIQGTAGAQGQIGSSVQGTAGAQGAQGVQGRQGAIGTGAQGTAGALTISSNTDNYILTATGTSTVQGESALTFNGTTLAVTGNETITGNLTVDTNTFFVDSANNRVGIITTSPGYTLDNQGSTRLKGQVYGSTAPSSGQTGGIMSLNQSEPGTGQYNTYYFYSVSDSDTDSFGRASINVDAENGATISAFDLGYTTGGNITVLPGGITLSTLGTGFLNINTSRNYISKGGLDYNNSVGTSEVNGEIAYWGGGSVTAGNLYYYDSSGNWTAADASSESTSTGLLGIAKATGTASTVGMLLRGHARFTGNSIYTALTTVGAKLYIKTTAGGFVQSTAPSGAGQVVRVVGYVQSTANDQIYFCPDNTWVTIA